MSLRKTKKFKPIESLQGSRLDDIGTKPAKKASPPDQSFEFLAWTLGFRTVCGVDEAGRGPLAGPVVAAAVVLPFGKSIRGVDDSKKLSHRERTALAEEIIGVCAAHGVGIVDAGEIDRINILQASLKAMRIAVDNLDGPAPDIVFVDGHKAAPLDRPQVVLVGGDARCWSIAAASIIAKTVRDRIMTEYHERWPAYGFDRHKGYGTRRHLEALRREGPCPIHRRTFAPVRAAAERL